MVPELRSALSLFEKKVAAEDPCDPSAALSSENDLHKAEGVVAWCRERGAQIAFPGHEFYPKTFLRLEQPPLFLSFFGRPVWSEMECISVVGSREPTRNALGWMERWLPEFIRATGAATVSGGARGIDQCAHAVSIRMGKPTVLFLPSGLKQMYPPEISGWCGQVLKSGGAIVSPYAPEQMVRRNHFEGRNKLIAAMGRMLLVVEARQRSGSIMTARLARDLARTVGALPSFPNDARSAGTLDLIADGSLMIRDATDLRVAFELSSSC